MSREVDNYPRALKHHATRKEVTVSFLLMLEQQQRAQKAAAALHDRENPFILNIVEGGTGG